MEIDGRTEQRLQLDAILYGSAYINALTGERVDPTTVVVKYPNVKISKEPHPCFGGCGSTLTVPNQLTCGREDCSGAFRKMIEQPVVPMLVQSPCPDCKGSRTYQPLTGPAEPCRTCCG